MQQVFDVIGDSAVKGETGRWIQWGGATSENFTFYGHKNIPRGALKVVLFSECATYMKLVIKKIQNDNRSMFHIENIFKLFHKTQTSSEWRRQKLLPRVVYLPGYVLHCRDTYMKMKVVIFYVLFVPLQTLLLIGQSTIVNKVTYVLIARSKLILLSNEIQTKLLA